MAPALSFECDIEWIDKKIKNNYINKTGCMLRKHLQDEYVYNIKYCTVRIRYRGIWLYI
jgi:predicted helicase